MHLQGALEQLGPFDYSEHVSFLSGLYPGLCPGFCFVFVILLNI